MEGAGPSSEPVVPLNHMSSDPISRRGARAGGPVGDGGEVLLHNGVSLRPRGLRRGLDDRPQRQPWDRRDKTEGCFRGMRMCDC